MGSLPSIPSVEDIVNVGKYVDINEERRLVTHYYVRADTTFGSIKALISKSEGLPIDRQRLVHSLDVMDDTATILKHVRHT